MAAASEEGLNWEGGKDVFNFFKEGKEVLSAPRVGRSFKANFAIVKIKHQAMFASDLNTWHRRLAHLHIELVKKMQNEEIVEGLKVKNKMDTDCVVRKLNKCKRSSHQSISTAKATKSVQSLHMDVIGPINPDSLNGHRFILCCKDEFSAYRYSIPLISKAKVPEAAKIIINHNQAMTDTNNEVQCLTTDNGTEFTSERLELFLQYKGIIHRKSAAYFPQQNGTAERENQSLLNQARTLLNASD